MSDMNWLDNLLLGVGMLATVVVLFAFVWRSWALLTEDDVNLTSIVAVLSPCLCFLPFFVIKSSPRTRKPDWILGGGVVVVLLCAYPSTKRTDARRAAQQAEREASIRNAALERAARTPSRLGAGAPGAPPPAVVPEMGGKSVDLSSIMGRARALANAWQPEAALLGIEANGLRRGVLQTDDGGNAKLVFGPGTFAQPGSKTGTFVVTYDKAGLVGKPSTASGGKPLVEPMCAPERVYDLAAGSTGASITLRYGRDAQQAVAWFASDPAAPKLKPMAFDAQSCRQLQHR